MTTTFSTTLFLPTSCPHHNSPSNFLLPSTTETLRKNQKKKINEKNQNTKLNWKDVIDYVLPIELGILILQDPAWNESLDSDDQISLSRLIGSLVQMWIAQVMVRECLVDARMTKGRHKGLVVSVTEVRVHLVSPSCDFSACWQTCSGWVPAQPGGFASMKTPQCLHGCKNTRLQASWCSSKSLVCFFLGLTHSHKTSNTNSHPDTHDRRVCWEKHSGSLQHAWCHNSLREMLVTWHSPK